MFDFWKKRDNDINNDEFSGIDDFNFDDFGFESTPVDTSRNPALDIGVGLGRATLGSFKNSDIEDSIRRSLPDEYGAIFDTKNQFKDAYKEVYDNAVKEFQPYKEDLKNLTKRALSATESVLPEKVFAKLKDLVKDDNTFSTQSKEARERAAINAELASIFETQAKIDQDRESRQDKKDNIKDIIEHDRHRDTFSQLDAIRRAVISQTEYQDNVLLKYQRKHLESEIKQTNILARLVEETTAFRVESKTALDKITKNTGLPDYVKLLGSERFKATVTQRFYDSTLDRFSRSDNFISNVVREAKEGALGWISSFANGLGTIATGVSAIPTADDDMPFGPKMTKFEMAGEFAGTELGNWLKGKTTNVIKDYLTGKKDIKGKKFPWADQINAGGHQAQIIMDNLPYYLNQYIQEAQISTTNSGKLAILDIMDGLVSNASRDKKHTLKSDNIFNLHDPAIFSNRVSKSITDVIPGYLAKILKEITIFRTGNLNTKELVYDYQVNKFDTTGNIANRVVNNLIPENSSKIFNRRAKNYFSDIDKNKELDGNDYNEIARLFNSSIGKKNILFNKDFLTNPKTYSKIFDEEKSKRVALLMSNYLKDDNGEKVAELIRMYSDVTPNIRNFKGSAQLLMDSGYRDILLDKGIIDNDNTIDNNKIYDYLTGKEKRGIDEGIVTLPNEKTTNIEQAIQKQKELTRSDYNSLDIARNKYLNDILMQMRECCEKKEEDKSTLSVISAINNINDTIIKSNNEVVSAILSMSQVQIASNINPEESSKYLESIKDMISNISSNDSNVKDKSNKRGILGTIGKIGYKGSKLYGKYYLKTLELISKGTMGLTKHGTNIGGKLSTVIRSKYDAMDVYIKGEAVPRLRKHVMDTGGYFNEDGSIIKKFSDIKGKVLDQYGNVVITIDEFDKATIFDTTKGFIGNLKDLIGNSLKIGKDISFTTGKSIFGMYAGGFKFAGKVLAEGLDEIVSSSNLAHDVYLKGVSRPALLRKKMLRGDYTDVNTMETITKVSDITGAVMDEKGNYVLTEEEFQSGLVDKFGKEFKGLVTFATNLASNAVRFGLRQGKKVFKATTDIAKRLINRSKHFLSKIKIYPNYEIESIKIDTGIQTLSVLEKIYLLLDKRLPGGKRLGDTDGDGDIENSVADIIQKRKTEALNKKTNVKDKESTKKEEEKGKGIFGFLWDKVKSLGAVALGGIGAAITTALVGGAKIAGKILKSVFVNAATLMGKSILGALSAIPGMTGLAKGAASIGGGILSKFKGGISKLAGLLKGKGGKLALGGLAASALYSLLGNEANASEVGSQLSDYDVSGNEGMTDNLFSGAVTGYTGLQGIKAAQIAKAGGRVGGRVFAPLAVGMDGYEMFKGIQTGDTNRMIQGSMGAAGAGVGAAIGGLFFGVGAIPGAMIGSALGWLTGKVTNTVRKFIKKGKLTEMEEVRFVQYGFDPKKDKDKIDRILNMEKILEAGLVLKGNKYDIEFANIDRKSLCEIFGINEASGNHELMTFNNFIVHRVIPILTASVLALRSIEPNKVLEYLDKLSTIDKVKFITAMRSLSPSTYSYTTPVFADGGNLLGEKEVVKYLDRKTHELKEKYKKETLKDKDGFFSSPWFENDNEYKLRKENEEKEINKKLDEATSTNNQALVNVVNNVSNANMGNIRITTSDDLLKNGFISPDGSIKLDALTCVRFVAYGLKDFTDVTKITQLRKIEEFLGQSNTVTVDSIGNASFNGGLNNIYKRIGNILNLNHVTHKKFQRWVERRLIPVYVKFRAALGFFKINIPDLNRIKTLKSSQKLTIANSVLTATQSSEKINHSSTYTGGNSVFDLTEGPWTGYDLSNNSSYAKEYLNFLEIKAKDDTKIEEQKLSDKEKVKLETVSKPTNSDFVATSSNTESNADNKVSYSSSVSSTPLMMKSASNQNTINEISDVITDNSSGYVPGKGMAPLARSSYDASQLDFSQNDSTLAGIAKAMLEKAGASSSDTNKYLPVLVYTLQKYGITKREHMAAFIAQLVAESKFKPKRENMNYSSVDRLADVWPNRFGKNGKQRHIAHQLVRNPKALANAVYNGRMNNRSGSDDGWNYRGGGFIQLTGKSNYEAFKKSSGIDVVSNPDLLTDPNVAMLAAGYFWQSNNLGNVLDNQGFDKLSQRINGGTIGLQHRRQAYALANSVTNANPVNVDKPQLSGFTPTESSKDIINNVSTDKPSVNNADNAGFINTSVESISTNSGYGVTNNHAYKTTPITPDMDLSSGSSGYAGSVSSSNSILSPRVQSLVNPAIGNESSTNQDDIQTSNNNSKAAKAADIARTNAKEKSTGKCARFVRIALQKAGYKFDSVISAYMYVDILPRIGFTKIASNTPPQKGDIVIYGEAPTHPHGHIQIYDGRNWISDFIQKSINPYRNKSSAGVMTLWRDTNSVPNNKQDIQNKFTTPLPLQSDNTNIGSKSNNDTITLESTSETIGFNNPYKDRVSSENTAKVETPDLEKPVLTSSPVFNNVDRKNIHEIRERQLEVQTNILNESMSIAKEHLSISKESLEVLRLMLDKIGNVNNSVGSENSKPANYQEPKEFVAGKAGFEKKVGEAPSIALGVTKATV